ncbi:helix-turn-helix transcriptional regulator [Streptococcus hohhotensis]|uniref:Helix-turn-helix transcriptional regulator n=2 Tax=Streptococcus TaxID=1301 RepID=A0ABT6QCR1_9STRE|nr:helix-turn-helix transcriptional regulator [Streptococcus sp. IMAU 99199]MDI2139254.1 helix-turn-helix transcriptional regulator [Streptococcus sp. IMAU 99199]
MKNKVNELEVKNRLKELREKENLSLNKLKKILKETYDISVSDSQLMYYENGTRKPRNQKIWDSLAKHFGVSVGYLLGYDNSPSKIFLKELEEQADHYLTDEEKEELKARPEAKNYYLDLVGWRMRDEQLAQLQQRDKEFDKDFIKFIEKYSIYLSDDQIEQIKDSMKSMSSINNKYLMVTMAGGYFEQMKSEKENEFKELFKYSKIWKENYSTMEYNEKNNIK